MKACLVVIACMLAIIPTATSRPEALIKKDLHDMSKPTGIARPAVLKIVRFKTANYKSGCECTGIQGFGTDSGVSQIFHGKICTDGDTARDGFECALVPNDALPAEYRWNPTTDCTNVGNCTSNANFECNGVYSFGSLKYCVKEVAHRTATIGNPPVDFCPCEQL